MKHCRYLHLAAYNNSQRKKIIHSCHKLVPFYLSFSKSMNSCINLTNICDLQGFTNLLCLSTGLAKLELTIYMQE